MISWVLWTGFAIGYTDISVSFPVKNHEQLEGLTDVYYGLKQIPLNKVCEQAGLVCS